MELVLPFEYWILNQRELIVVLCFRLKLLGKAQIPPPPLYERGDALVASSLRMSFFSPFDKGGKRGILTGHWSPVTALRAQ
jgi:hypothetical protein